MLVQSQIRSVTVYNDRALVERISKVKLEAGDHSITFGSLPLGLNTNSIQVNGGQNCILQEIKVKDVYLDEIPDKSKKEIVAEIERLEESMEEIQDKINNLNEEKQLLQKLANVPSDSPKKGIVPLLSTENVKDLLNFYSQKLNQLDSELRLNKKELKKLEESINILKEQSKSFHKTKLKSEKQIDIKVLLQDEAEVVLILSYIIMNAGWKPIYDFRLDSDAKKLTISYNAIITQKTGENWDNVILSLSTAKPQISAVQPEIATWFIDIYEPIPLNPKMSKKSMGQAMMPCAKEMASSSDMLYDESPMPIIEAKVETGATAVNFVIPGNHTILDNNEEHKIGICVFDLEAKLDYISIPKLTPFAFLTSTTVNTSDFPMLAGNVNVFLDNNFVSNSAIKLVAPNQEFKTSLGIDEAVQIEYKLLNKFLKDEGIFSKKSKLIYEYAIQIKNNKKIDCSIKIKDQIPLSQNQEIKVDLIEPKYKEETSGLSKSTEGIIEWKFDIKPGEKTQLILKFSVEYPKEREIMGLE